MEVKVKLYAVLRRYRPETAGGEPHHPFSMSLPDQATIRTLAEQLGIPDGMITAAGRNDNAVELDTILRNGDKVHLFPPSAGGGSGVI